MTKVVHLKREPYDVRIDRATKWGNPFLVGAFGREGCIAAYREWIQTRPDLINSLHELRGKVLGCWCSPLACHGDVLCELADSLENFSKDGETPES